MELFDDGTSPTKQEQGLFPDDMLSSILRRRMRRSDEACGAKPSPAPKAAPTDQQSIDIFDIREQFCCRINDRSKKSYRGDIFEMHTAEHREASSESCEKDDTSDTPRPQTQEKDSTYADPSRFRRQSPAFAVARFFRRLPICAAAAGAVAAPIELALYSVSKESAALFSFLLSAGVVAVTAAVIWAVLEWRCDTWYMQDGGVFRRRGILTVSEWQVSSDALADAITVRTPFSALFRAVNIEFSDISIDGRRDHIIISKTEAGRLSDALIHIDGMPRRRYAESALRIIAFAAFGNRPLSGLLLAAPVLSAVGEYIDRTLISRLYMSAEETVGGIISDLSGGDFYQAGQTVRSIIIAAWILPLAGWAISFMHDLFSHSGFLYELRDSTVVIRRGMISRRCVRLPRERICAVDIRETVLSRLLRLKSGVLLMHGGGEYRFLPASPERRRRIECASLIGGSTGRCIMEVCPDDERRSHFPLKWWITLMAAGLLTARLCIQNPQFSGIYLPAALPILIVILWKVLISRAEGKSAAVKIYADRVEMVGVSGLTLHEMRTARESIGCIKITRSPWQRIRGVCTMRIRPAGAKHYFRCRYLPPERALAAAERLC